MTLLSSWLQKVEKFQKQLVIKSQSGDIMALQSYSIELGKLLTTYLEQEVYTTDEFINFTNSQKALYMRETVRPLIDSTHKIVMSLSFESLNILLKKRGILVISEMSTDVSDRTSILIGAGIARIVADEYDAAVNIWRGGFEQMVTSAPRTAIKNTSKKVKDFTGKELEGQRVIAIHADPCDYCLSKAHSSFNISDTDFNGFHDYCGCRIEVL